MATTTPSPSPPLPLRQSRRLAISAAVVLGAARGRWDRANAGPRRGPPALRRRCLQPGAASSERRGGAGRAGGLAAASACLLPRPSPLDEASQVPLGRHDHDEAGQVRVIVGTNCDRSPARAACANDLPVPPSPHIDDEVATWRAANGNSPSAARSRPAPSVPPPRACVRRSGVAAHRRAADPCQRHDSGKSGARAHRQRSKGVARLRCDRPHRRANRPPVALMAPAPGHAEALLRKAPTPDVPVSEISMPGRTSLQESRTQSQGSVKPARRYYYPAAGWSASASKPRSSAQDCSTLRATVREDLAGRPVSARDL